MRLVSRKPSEAQPARMRALARLPLFVDLNGRRAVVAGGSAAAAWKAELLAAAGAAVEIHAEDVGEEMRGLLARGAAGGSLSVMPHSWRKAAFDGVAIAVADLAEAEGEQFAAAARAAGVPCNVVDKPRLCSFQFGAIVNRSPVVIGISTDGSAPILGQAIRRRIETLLHPALSGWAALAKSAREIVAQRLPAGAARRAFWDRFSERALSGMTADPGAVPALLDQAGTIRPAGRVTLVGAGPGDAELLTLKAVRALQAADVILFDDLVSGDVLELARREAKRLLVGKRGGRASCAQEEINDLMIRLARQGQHVVRLKSGDPMIFGRAGEEIERLDAAGITVDVVPGITAGLALASSLGVSLTHRDVAQSVRFVTGCARTGEVPDDLDWRGLADNRTSTVFYMAARKAGCIAARLILEGMDGTTPAVAAAGVSRPDEVRWRGSLQQLGAAADSLLGGAPIVIGIGNVFAARENAASAPPAWKQAV